MRDISQIHSEIQIWPVKAIYSLQSLTVAYLNHFLRTATCLSVDIILRRAKSYGYPKDPGKGIVLEQAKTVHRIKQFKYGKLVFFVVTNENHISTQSLVQM